MNRLEIMATALFMLSCSNDKVIKIGIQPYNNFNQALSDTVSNTLKKTYGVSVYVLEKKDIPEKTYINLKVPRYRADRLIKILKEEKPDSLNYIIALTDKDISTTKKDADGNIREPKSKYEDWGIFGLGYRPGPSCIVSTFRIKNSNSNKFVERLKKISIHELGHNLGLEHCVSKKCVMRDAVETIKTIDNVNSALCNNCRKKLNP